MFKKKTFMGEQWDLNPQPLEPQTKTLTNWAIFAIKNYIKNFLKYYKNSIKHLEILINK